MVWGLSADAVFGDSGVVLPRVSGADRAPAGAWPRETRGAIIKARLSFDVLTARAL